MREIVIGQTTRDDFGCVSAPVWFRVAIPADADPVTPRPGRQSQYAETQQGYKPQAPGDYANADAGEVTDFQAGRYRELPPISVPIDPTWSNADVAAHLASTSANVNGDILTWLLADRQAKLLAYDDERFGLLGTSYAAGAWAPSRA